MVFNFFHFLGSRRYVQQIYLLVEDLRAFSPSQSCQLMTFGHVYLRRSQISISFPTNEVNLRFTQQQFSLEGFFRPLQLSRDFWLLKFRQDNGFLLRRFSIYPLAGFNDSRSKQIVKIAHFSTQLQKGYNTVVAKYLKRLCQ